MHQKNTTSRYIKFLNGKKSNRGNKRLECFIVVLAINCLFFWSKEGRNKMWDREEEKQDNNIQCAINWKQQLMSVYSLWHRSDKFLLLWMLKISFIFSFPCALLYSRHKNINIYIIYIYITNSGLNFERKNRDRCFRSI